MKIIFSSLTLLLTWQFIQAQACRDATPAEWKAYQKLVAALDEHLTTPLSAGDWEVSDKNVSNAGNFNVAKSPAPRPIMVCSNVYEVSFTLRQGSQAAKTMADSSEYYMDQANNVTDQKKQLQLIKQATHFMNAGQFRITVGADDPDYYLQSPSGGHLAKHYTPLSIPGAALVFQVWYEPQRDDDEPIQQTVVCLGKWSAAMKKQPNNDWLFHYSFAHPAGTPFIENAVIVIEADAVRAKELLKKVDWSMIKAALTE